MLGEGRGGREELVHNLGRYKFYCSQRKYRLKKTQMTEWYNCPCVGVGREKEGLHAVY